MKLRYKSGFIPFWPTLYTGHYKRYDVVEHVYKLPIRPNTIDMLALTSCTEYFSCIQCFSHHCVCIVLFYSYIGYASENYNYIIKDTVIGLTVISHRPRPYLVLTCDVVNENSTSPTALISILNLQRQQY